MNLIDLIKSYEISELKNHEEIVKLSKDCCIIKDNFYNNLPFHINVISSAARGRLKETAHSKILHDLLHYPQILSSFLEKILKLPSDIFNIDDIRYPDQDRIDISLVSKKNKKFLIIENKINDAQEQPGQIYRYVLNALQQGYRLNEVVVLYLNSDNNDAPSLFSRSKDGFETKEEGYTVPLEMVTIKNYKYDILNWLKSIEDSIVPHENELKSALSQYIDYLEEYFQTKHKFTKLHNMTQKEIIKLLDLENYNIEDKIQILTSKISELTQLKSEMESLNRDLMNEEWNTILNNLLTKFNKEYEGKILFRKFSNSIPEMGFDIQSKNSIFHVTLIYWNFNPYWRIYGDKKMEDKERSDLQALLKPYFPTINGPWKDDGWDLFCKTSKENCGLRLQQLANVIMNSKEFTVIK